MEISEIQYTKSGDFDLAYQRYGAGPDVVLIPPLVANVELSWEQEVYRRVREHIGQYVRVLEFDPRGGGSSDRFEFAPTLEERISDVNAVMDAEGVERANVVGVSVGGTVGQFFAAMRPERVDRLVLINSQVGASAYHLLPAYTDSPLPDVAAVLSQVRHVFERWGRDPAAFVDLLIPSQKDNPAFIRWFARFQRQTATPADIKRHLESTLSLDPNEHLADIKAPTLVMNVTGSPITPSATGRYLADNIPGARHVEFPGGDDFPWAIPNWRQLMDCWVEFVTGTVPPAEIERRFATVLFTDIVDSTSRCTEVGDDAWRTMLDHHDRIAWNTVERHRGALVKNTGDGLLLTFDTPSAAVAFASEFRRELESVGIVIRTGLHAGEIEVREDGDVVGLAVSLAARVEETASPGAIYVSSTVRDLLLGSVPSFEDRGEHVLKGINGAWRVYELTP